MANEQTQDPDAITIVLDGIEPVTHDVRSYRAVRPDGYRFEPGQATEVHVDRDGWRDEDRPFTFTSLPEDDHLEFTIKSYPSHDGVTEQIGELKVGDRLVIGESWGAIKDAGPGVFIAGGAGVTPFISILRRRQRDNDLDGCHLIFSNKTEADIILRSEFEAMDGLTTSFIVTEDPESPFAAGRLDAELLHSMIETPDQKHYVCGPPGMVEDIGKALASLGVDENDIITEDFD